MTRNDRKEIIVSDTNIDEDSFIKSVAEAIASLENGEPTDIPPLYYTINTEALNEVFGSTAQNEYIHLEFTHDEYKITVEKDPDLKVSVKRL